MARLKDINITQSEAMYYIYIYLNRRDDVRENQARQLFLNIYYGWKEYTEERRIKKQKYKELDQFANNFRMKYAIEILICNTENSLNAKENEVLLLLFYFIFIV